MELTRFRGRLRTVATKRSDMNPLNFIQRDLLAQAIVELGRVGGPMPRDPARDLEVAAVPKILGDPGPVEAVGTDLGTTTAAARLMLGIFTALVEFKRELIRDRTASASEP